MLASTDIFIATEGFVLSVLVLLVPTKTPTNFTTFMPGFRPSSLGSDPGDLFSAVRI